MNVKEYKQKLKQMEALLALLTNQGELSKKDQKELDLVSEQIAEYEELNYAFKPETLKEMIELRMFQRKLKQKDVAIMLDTTPSRISELLNGKRSMTFELAKKLHKKLNIDAELILTS